MARKIIILERVAMPSDRAFRVAFWLDVPAARRSFYANANATSAVVGATQAEVDALKAGSVVEVLEALNRPTGTTQAAMQSALQSRHTQLQQDLIDRNPYERYGTSWDGTTWTAGGVV